MKFSDLQTLLKEKFGIDHLADIARELDVSPQAVSNWKARDKVPYKYILKLRKDLDNLNVNQLNNEVNDSKKYLKKEINLENQNSAPEEEFVSLADIFLVIAREIKLIITVPLILCTATIIYALFFTTPVYESNAKIMSSSSSDNVNQASGLAAQFGINLPTSQSKTEWVYPEIVKSRTIAKEMLNRKFDTEKYGSQITLLKILTYPEKQKPDHGLDTLVKSGVSAFNGMINIKANGLHYDLTVSAFEPLFARDLAIALIDELDSYQKAYNRRHSSETRKFIEERIVDTRFELETAEEVLKDFTDRNRRIENSPSLQLERQRLLREVSVLTGVFTTLKQQLETTKIEEVKESDYVVVLDKPEAPLFRSKPKRRLMVIFSGLLGIGLGIFLAFIKQYNDNRLEDDQKKIYKAKSLLFENFFDLIPSFFRKK